MLYICAIRKESVTTSKGSFKKYVTEKIVILTPNLIHRHCEYKSILTIKTITRSYLPFTYIMLATNCNNFEVFGPLYCPLSIDLPNY